MKFTIINGPNMNMLGLREAEHYGQKTYQEMIEIISNHIDTNYSNINYEFFQSNHEGEIIDYIHKIIKEDYDGIIINPAAYSHYSIAILDALKIFKKTKVEVHLSDVYSRDSFRQNLITAQGCDKIIAGAGIDGYLQAVDYLICKL